jgi:hypothetical protein
MVPIEIFRQMALALPETVELPHFERTSFRVNKKIFATLDERSGIACLMLSDIEQSVFCAIDRTIIYPVPNKWGLQGATYFELQKVQRNVVKDALEKAYSKKAAVKLKMKKG